MFSLRLYPMPRYLRSMMRRPILVMGILLLLVGCPSRSLASQGGLQEQRFTREQHPQRQRETSRSRYISRADSLINELKGVASQHHDLGRLQVYTTNAETIPPNGVANLSSLVNLVDEAFELWSPTVDRPLRVYFLDYATYREYATKFNNVFLVLWPNQKQPIPESTLGFFVPLSTGEDVYILYTWAWFVHLHEILHIALSHQVSVLTGTNHKAVDPEVQHAWLSPGIQALVDAATKGELG